MSVRVRLRLRVRVRVRRRGSLREQVRLRARVRLRLRLEPRLYRRQRHVTEEREPGASRLRTGAGGRGVREHTQGPRGAGWRRRAAGAAEHACSLSSCSAESSVALAALMVGLAIMTKNAAGEIDSEIRAAAFGMKVGPREPPGPDRGACLRVLVSHSVLTRIKPCVSISGAAEAVLGYSAATHCSSWATPDRPTRARRATTSRR